MSRKSLFVLLIVALLVGVIVPAAAQDKTTVNWFVGLGTGTNDEQIEAQNQVVADFNASQDEIELVITIVPYESGRDTLSTLIAAGTPPDIVGPVGVGGSNDFIDQWLDLQPLVDSAGYDLSAYPEALVNLYRTGDGGLVGIPFAVFPSMTLYNRGLFDEAGLNYPPAAFDAPYVWEDGTEAEWNYDTAVELAKILTVDATGNDATMEEFDPDNIVQFGFHFQFAGMRTVWTHVQPEDWYDEETGTITIADSWREITQRSHDMIWKDHVSPNSTYAASELFGSDNPFNSGNVAMAVVPTWYTCCLGNSVGNFEWDFAVVPKSLDGEYHAATDADTFRMTKTGTNQEAAFTVLSYLLNEAVPILAPVYGAFPAREEYRQIWIDSKDAQYDWGINWDLAGESLNYSTPGNMHHESYSPNSQKVNSRVAAFETLLRGDTGADMDVTAELDLLQADLQAIVDEVE